MEGFWLGWWIIFFSLYALTAVVLGFLGAGWAGQIGIILGFGFVGLLTYSLQFLTFIYIFWAFVIMIALAFIKMTLIHERQVYKWTNGRPEGER